MKLVTEPISASFTSALLAHSSMSMTSKVAYHIGKKTLLAFYTHFYFSHKLSRFPKMLISSLIYFFCGHPVYVTKLIVLKCKFFIRRPQERSIICAQLMGHPVRNVHVMQRDETMMRDQFVTSACHQKSQASSVLKQSSLTCIYYS